MTPIWAEMSGAILVVSHLAVAFLFLTVGFRMGRGAVCLPVERSMPYDPGKPEEDNLMETDPFNRALYGTVQPTMPDEERK